MAGRVFWFAISGAALLTGMVLQDGGRIFSWADDHTDVSIRTQQAIERGVERAVDRSIVRMDVVGADGREIAVSPDTKRAFADAVGRLAKAESSLAMLKIRDAADDEIGAATNRRDRAKSEVDRLKAEMRGERTAVAEDAADRQQLQSEIQQEVRDSIRDAVKN